jgi:RNA polymerase sigma-70 factor (ECF subfamily)
MPPPDSELGQWFAAHIQPHEAMLRGWLQSRFGARLAVDDIVQEAYLRIWQARVRGELHAPKAFLFATARNVALDSLRRHHNSRTVGLGENEVPDVLDERDDIPETVARNQELALLTEAIQTLPERCRQVFTLRAVYGLSQRDIAGKLGISDRTVAAQLAIGVAKCSDYVLRRLERPRPQ